MSKVWRLVQWCIKCDSIWQIKWQYLIPARFHRWDYVTWIKDNS